MGIQSDGRIVLAGVILSIPFSQFAQPLLRRYHSDGVIDTSFGSGGSVFGADEDFVNSMALDGQGRILVVGWRGYLTPDIVGLVARYTVNGALDTSFAGAGNGIWLSGSPVNEGLIGIAVVTGNKIVVGGMRATDVPIVPVDVITYRLDTNGVLDTTFGVGGVGELSSPGVGGEGVRGLAVNAAGDIAMGGENPSTGGVSDWFVIRY